MDGQEKAVIWLLSEAWNAFTRLEQIHQDDAKDFSKAIHDAQRIVFARPGIKEYWEESKEKESEEKTPHREATDSEITRKQFIRIIKDPYKFPWELKDLSHLYDIETIDLKPDENGNHWLLSNLAVHKKMARLINNHTKGEVMTSYELYQLWGELMMKMEQKITGWDGFSQQLGIMKKMNLVKVSRKPRDPKNYFSKKV